MNKSLAWAMEKYALVNPSYAWLKDLVESAPGKLVLNPGSGDGSPLTNLFYKHGAEIISLDLSLKNLRKNPHLKIQGNALYLPFENGVFDFLISEDLILNTLYRQNEVGKFIKEVGRVLKPGGYYLGNEYQAEYDNFISSKLFDAAKFNYHFVLGRKL